MASAGLFVLLLLGILIRKPEGSPVSVVHTEALQLLISNLIGEQRVTCFPKAEPISLFSYSAISRRSPLPRLSLLSLPDHQGKALALGPSSLSSAPFPALQSQDGAGRAVPGVQSSWIYPFSVHQVLPKPSHALGLTSQCS